MMYHEVVWSIVDLVFFKQKTAYEVRISDWSSDVCSSDLGSCGTAAYMRQPVFVTDIANDPKWAKFKDLALAADLRACWSAPIPGHDGEAVGALALYFREPRIPLEHEDRKSTRLNSSH